jgi:hypothetical protein
VAYLIDCDAIAHLDGADHCGVVIDGLKKLVIAGTLKTVEQVYDELRRWPHLQKEFKPIKKAFIVSSVPTLIEQSQLVGRNGLGHDDRLQRK